MIHLNNSHVTKPLPECVKEMLPFLDEEYLDPYGLGAAANRVREKLLKGVPHLYALAGAKEKDAFVFTSSLEEAISQLYFSAYSEIALETGKNQFLTASTANAASLVSGERFSKFSVVFKLLDVDGKGAVTADELIRHVTPRTAFLSLPAACGLTGVIYDLSPLVEICQEREIFFHVDISHLLGKLPFNFEELGADAITFDGSLFHAPLGTAGLFLKEGAPLTTLIHGAAEQGGYRSGKFPTSLFSALICAAKEAKSSLDFLALEGARLRDSFETLAQEKIPDVEVLFADEKRLPTVSLLSVKGVSSEALLYLLDRKKVAATIGGGSSQTLHHLLSKMGFAPEVSHTSLSFSLSRFTTDEEIEKAVDTLAAAAQTLRKSAFKTN